MTGAFEEGEGDYFVSPAKTVKMEFFFVSSTRDPGVF